MQKLYKEYLSELKTMKLFYGIQESEMTAMLGCIGAYLKEYKKNQYIITLEENVEAVGILLSGKVDMIKEDLWGNKTLLVSMQKGELFGESFSCGIVKNATVSFVADTASMILFLPFSRILRTCNMSCKFHHRLIENMVTVSAEQNIVLMDKVDILSKKTLREKIATYLLQEASKQQSLYFDIPLGRVQLAEYLCVDRSALTRELNTMKAEGYIDFDKNTFRVLKNLE